MFCQGWQSGKNGPSRSLLLMRMCVAALLSLMVAPSCRTQEVDFACDPSVERRNFAVKGIFHGTKDNPFGQQVQAAAIQAGKVIRVKFDVELDDTFDLDQVVQDIGSVVAGDDPPNALVVTIPFDSVASAVSEVINAGVPVFGLNNGYQSAKYLRMLGFVAMDERIGGRTYACCFCW